ncbi:MAG: class I SAM-dependent methyltransferase family protein [Euryarchaeota archaeon]|nr:class I SAM-dependent methyltransferase family protein [Euryarchaeota archaeon]
MEETIFKRICTDLKSVVGKENLASLPKTYEMIGHILIIYLTDELSPWKKEIGKVYLRHYPRAKTVLRKGPITGEYRKPKYEHLAGNGTETIHKENKIQFKLDLEKVMFSSGNIEERQRMGRVPKKNEKVVDMFAGIGYFSLPMAYHAGASVTAIEKNPEAFHYLQENIKLNNVEDRVEALNMDCLDFSGTGNRVVMGYLRKTNEFLGKAFEIVKKGGIIHYHQTVVENFYPKAIHKEIRAVTKNYEIISMRRVKKFSPGVWHIVADIKAL